VASVSSPSLSAFGPVPPHLHPWPHRAPRLGTVASQRPHTRGGVPDHWQNSTPITGDIIGKITRRKQQPGKNIMIPGSATLVRCLLREGLLDELRLLLLFPLVLGGGERLFDDWAARLPLQQVELLMLDTGPLLQLPASTRMTRQGLEQGCTSRCAVAADPIGRADGLAWRRVRLVIAYTVTRRQHRRQASAPGRVRRMAWVACRKPRFSPATVAACRPLASASDERTSGENAGALGRSRKAWHRMAACVRARVTPPRWSGRGCRP
jgi:hypothetical protein